MFRRLPHGSAGRAALAAAAVVLLGAGCTVPPAGAEAGAHRPGPGAPASAPTAPPSAAAPSVTASPGRTERTGQTGGPAEKERTRPPAAPRSAPPPPPPPPPPAAPPSARPSRPAAPPPVLREGDEGEKVRELQARLRQAGHFGLNPTGYYGSITTGSVSAFQKRQGLPAGGQVTTATWNALTARTRPPTRLELYPPTTRPLAKPDPRCLTGRALCVSKESRTLAWMVDGEVVSAMDVRFGSQLTPTREGAFSVTFKSRDHHSTLYDTPMPYAMFFSGGQAVHYSADFAANGYNGASHGCVNVRDRKRIAALFEQVRPGDKVIVF
ncbi:L,D-transpeptidase family protein [Streptomyces sp. TRM 70361]|uniref:L,D-transpeptidase family protein n=1 Tax=Streptomyces sp. TRM 70361 TaxID=3116553 RepID=UPI002E7C4836|nr:L,D-transpeptidase family protein [Streptomyces sp. TRM 70361]MEE1939398.1 L,D-transpeptidase family protein [Streptomyces sp. TRM 70361]